MELEIANLAKIGSNLARCHHKRQGCSTTIGAEVGIGR
jgi:hypothetical protein